MKEKKKNFRHKNLLVSFSSLWSQENETKYTEEVTAFVFQQFEKLVEEFNSAGRAPSQLHITQIRPGKFETTNLEDQEQNANNTDECICFRFSIYCGAWALSIRIHKSQIECFLLPSQELLKLENAETPANLKLSLGFKHHKQHQQWYLDNSLITDKDEELLLRSLFKDLLSRTKMTGTPTKEAFPHEGSASFARDVRALVGEKQLLSQKIVKQQEEVQARIARDLHDAVISDLMMLKRSLHSPKRLTDSEMEIVLDRTCQQLYDICEALAPRALKDWGLQTVTQGLLEGLSARTDIVSKFTCPQELPPLPDEVLLHLFRIIQESLTNIEKYACASEVKVEILNSNGILKITIEDNGKGMINNCGSPHQEKGGRGSGIMKERIELISCIYPARILFTPVSPGGTKITVEVQHSQA